MKNKSVSVRSPFVAELFLTLLGVGVGAGGCGGNPDTPQLGVTHAAVTAEGIGPELTQQGDIIAKVTHPMGGVGSKDLEVIRDGQKPSADDVANSLNQYDTFDNTTPNEAKTDDWIGYQYTGEVTFARVWFLEGLNFDNGGWFTTLNVQVRHNGTWTGVTSLAVTPPYQPNDGQSYDSYQLDFAPIKGDAIRIEGPPGGTARFISVAELQVWAAPGTSAAPAARPLGPDITGPGTPIAKITAPLGGGSKDLSIIKNTNTPVIGTGDSNSAALQYDTYTGDVARTEDWIGYSYDGTQFFGQLVLQVGMRFPDGGWFESLDVQVRQNGTWVSVADQNFTPKYPTDGSSPDFKAYQIDFSPIGGDGIRVFGQPGGASRFISVASLRVLAGNPCQGRTDGTDCSDGDLCTVGDRCVAGVCQPVAPYDCGAPDDACRGRGICQRATGTCTMPIAADPPPLGPNDPPDPDHLRNNPCDDGNKCTVHDYCSHGTCIPGSVAPACTGPNATFYAPVTNLGSFQGQSVARDINEQGMVVGNDTPGHDNSTVEFNGGQGVSQAFRWTEAEGMTYASSVGAVNIALGVNASGDIAGVGGSFRDWQNVLRSRMASGTSEIALTQAGGAAINDAGEIAGWGYFPGQPNVRMFRMSDGQPEVISPPQGSLETGVSAPKAIDSQGNMVGYVTDADSRNGLAVLVRQGTVFVLNDLLFDSPADPDHLWSLTEADAIHFDEVTGTDTIVGWGINAGVPHAFELILQGGTVPQLVDLKTLSPYDELTSYIHIPIPRDINGHGEVVGSFHDVHALWPTVPFVYVPYGPYPRMIKLNDLIDPASGWTLSAAFGINDNREVVGFGYLNGEARAYRMKLPDMTPCPVTDSCHAAPIRNPADGKCVDIMAKPLADGTPCQGLTACPTNNICVDGICGGQGDPVCLETEAVVDMPNGQFVAVFGYTSHASVPVSPKPNQFLVGGSVVANPKPSPPQVFFSEYHPAEFLPSFTAAQTVSWRVGGQMATASATFPTHLQPTYGADNDLVADLNGKQITVSRNLGKYSLDPTENSPAPGEPTLGDEFNGKLTGQFAVTPMGAATFTLPISLPPGIAGMLPNLSLTYNSQGGDGIAGQGWELTGLSVIHRCAKTKLQDGVSFPVINHNIQDSLCLDGQRLFQNDDGSYFLQKSDFSKITANHDKTIFTVVTKTGEIHVYGSTANSRISLFSVGDSKSPTEIVVWALDQVIDTWGNYYTIDYNYGNQDFVSKGLIATSMSYTGHIASALGAVQPPFYKVWFDYETRRDVRTTRFGQYTLQRSQRLKKISIGKPDSVQTNPLRTYELTYIEPLVGNKPTVDDLMLPSRLLSIQYCVNSNTANRQCLEPISFGWDGSGGYHWEQQTPYALQASIQRVNGPNGPSLDGAAFVDVDLDGLPDLLFSKESHPVKAWRNTGTDWETAPSDWLLPQPVADTNGKATQTRFVDMDGDGVLDFVTQSAPIPGIDQNYCDNHTTVINKNMPPQCGDLCILTGPFFGRTVSEQYTCTPAVWSPAVYMNHTQLGRGWELDTSFGLVKNGKAIDLSKGFIVDLDGDGRAEYADVSNGHWQLTTYKNVGAGSGWAKSDGLSFDDSSAPDTYQIRDWHFEDVNRDGLPDFVLNPGAVAPSAFNVILNQGDIWYNGIYGIFGSDDLGTSEIATRFVGDIDGDGYRDSAFYKGPVVTQDCDDCGLYAFTVTAPKVNVSTGTRYWGLGTDGWVKAVTDYAPKRFAPVDQPNYNFALVDLNADGLADFVLSHSNGGQLLINNGSAWVDIENQPPAFTLSAGQKDAVPVVPADYDTHLGAAFIDINGDGVPDLVQSRPCVWAPSVAPCNSNGDALDAHTWINKYRPPTISSFPNGLARAKVVSYVVTTAAEGHQTYSDTAELAADTIRVAMPIRVVSSVTDDDGVGGYPVTTYRYNSLRASNTGRGSQGFHDVTVVDPSGEKTVTTYAQTFPYTGLPLSVVKTRSPFVGPPSDKLVSKTETTYCDLKVNNPDPATLPLPGFCQGVSYPPPKNPGDSFFVYPLRVKVTNVIWSTVDFLVAPPLPPPPADATVTITTDYRYDAFGNPTSTDVISSSSDGDSFENLTAFDFGASNSRQRREGKPLQRTETAKNLITGETPRIHVTAYEYGEVNSFAVNGQVYSALATTKQKIEPNAPAPDPNAKAPNSVRLDTAFDYDRFGHVVVETACANNFDLCAARARLNDNAPVCDPPARPTPAPNADQRQFRTTYTSYEPGDFAAPTGQNLATGISYLPGQFVVRKINPACHAEYTVYDPDLGGVLVQQTGPNGVSACNGYNAFGQKISSTARCGSAFPQKDSLHVFLNGADPRSSFNRTIAVTQAADGGTTWVLSDALGRVGRTMNRGLNGTLVTSAKYYDHLGRVESEEKPHLVQNSSPAFAKSYGYDTLNRPRQITDDLGNVDGVADNTQSILSIRYAGLDTITEHTERGKATRTRKETKNVLGKMSSVETVVLDTSSNAQRSPTINYFYDPDGNLTDTLDSGENNIHIGYDIRGRKIQMTDPDLGARDYGYDGFGDLETAVDQLGTTTNTYDVLGRMTVQTSRDGTARWVYDVAQGAGIGKLAATASTPDERYDAPCNVENLDGLSGNRSGRWTHYTSLGDVDESFECVDGKVFSAKYGYDSIGRVDTLSYPEVGETRYQIQYHYDSTGHLFFVTSPTDNTLLWAGTEANALGQVTKEYTHNGVETVSNRNPSTGWLMGSSVTAHGDGDRLIQQWDNTYDQFGNLRSRHRSADVTTVDSTEAFTYDDLDRVRTSNLSAAGQAAKADTFVYDDFGNLTEKGGQTYSYAGCGGRPHAVCSIGDGPAFGYDPNGNMYSGLGRTLAYNASGKAVHIASASGVADFMYGSDANRVAELTSTPGTTNSRTVYFGLGSTGHSLYERTTNSGGKEHRLFLYAGGTHNGNAFAVKVIHENGSSPSSMRYYHFDHLGSVTAVTDENGEPDTDRQGIAEFDVWGAARDAATHSTNGATTSTVGNRGFTGHETVPGVGLVNMNGRMYDPFIGRFLSPDPTIQFASDLQSFNRYSYVQNNPLRYTDPTGYDLASFLQDHANTIVYVGQGIVIAVGCGATYGAGCAVAAAIFFAAESAVQTVENGGSINDVVFGAFVSGVSTVATMGIGGPGSSTLATAMIRGAVGGAVSAALMTARYGGDFGENVFKGAAQGAVVAGLTWAAVAGARYSQASAQGGNNEDKNLTISGRSGGTRTIQLPDGGTATVTYSPVSRAGDAPLGRAGVNVEVHVEGVDGADFVQNVSENGGPKRIDPAPMTHDRPGLYYSSDERSQYGSTFIDGPRRPVAGSWSGELSIVTRGADGGYQIVKTFSYGFSASGTWSLDPSVNTLSVRAAPFVEVRPSAFQVNNVRAIGQVP